MTASERNGEGETRSASPSLPNPSPSPPDMEALVALMEKATPGPWTFSPWHIEEAEPAVRAPQGWIIANTSSDINAQLIVAAVNALPRLLAQPDLSGEVDWEAERDNAVADCTAWMERAEAAEAEAADLRARLADREAGMGAMREALEPFAKMAEDNTDTWDDWGNWEKVIGDLTAGQFRRARQALSDHTARFEEAPAKRACAPGIEPEQSSERGEHQ